MSEIIIEIVGWIASLLIVGAYFFNIYKIWDTNSPLYVFSNLIGGVFFIINTFFHKAYPSMIVNVVWVLIAVAALLKKDKTAKS